MSNVIINPYNFGSPPFPNTYSLDFDGVDDYVDCGTSLDFVTGNHTLSFWIKTSDAPTVVLFEKGSNDELAAQIVSGGVLRWAGANSFDSATAINDGAWHHVAFIASGTDSYIYIDGSLDATGGDKTQGSSNTNNFYIGGRTTSFNLAGNLDEISIFNSAKAIGDLWNGTGKPTNLSGESGLIAWYRCGDSGTFFNGNWEIPSQPQIDNFSSHSFDFDGVDDKIDISSSAISGDITLSAWINSNGTYTAWQDRFPVSITPSHAGVPNATLGRFYHGQFGLFGPAMQLYDDAGANFATYYIGLDFEGAGWKHCVWTYNDTTKAIYFYLNGVRQDWTKWGGTPSNVPYLTATGYSYNSDLKIGTNTGSYFFEGKIDDVATWDTILDAATILSLYNSGVPNDLRLAASYTAGSGVDKSGDLQGFWRMGEGSYWNGTDWWTPDYSKNTLFSQKSLDFDGADDNVSLGNASLFDFSGGIVSISVWVYFDSLSNYDGIVAKRNLSGTPFCYMLSLDNTSKIRWLISQSDTTQKSILTNSTVSTGQWYHVLVIADGTNIKMYLNGTLQTDTDTYDGTIDTDAADLFIGRNANDEMNGKIDDVAIFSTDKSSSASAIYNSGVPTDLSEESGLVGYWIFDDATFSTNWTIPDNSSNSNNGTSANMVEVDLEFNTPGNLSAGLSSGMAIDDKVNNAPGNINQGLSDGMGETAPSGRSTDVP